MRWQHSPDMGKHWYDIQPHPRSPLVNCPQTFKHHDGVLDDECGNWYRKVSQ